MHRSILQYLTLAAFGVLMATSTPAAEAKGRSFAFVVAPEQGNYTCLESSAEKAAACAMKKCKKAGGVDCTVMAACFGGWSGVMGVMLEEFHFSEAVCGAPSKDAALSSLKAWCKGHAPNVRECFISELTSPEGKVEKLELSVDPKSLP